MSALSPAVSIVIPCRNEEACVEGLLAAIAAQQGVDFEIVLADGGSTDRTLAIVEGYCEAHPQLKLRLISVQQGNIAAGLNHAIRQARAEIIVRLDAHSLPAPDYVGRCLMTLKETDAAVVGGVWEIRPGATGLIPAAIALAVSSKLGAGNAQYRLRPSGGVREVDTVPFGCFHRSTWLELNGYNEQLLVNEDYEFHYRVRQNGGEIRLDPAIRCIYFARRNLKLLLIQYWRYGWWKAQMLKMYPRSLKWRQAVPALWVAIASGFLILGSFSLWARNSTFVAWAIYLMSLALGSITLSWKTRWRLFTPIIIVYVIIHFSWGFGFWFGLFGKLNSGIDKPFSDHD